MPDVAFHDYHAHMALKAGEEIWHDWHFAQAMAGATLFWDLSLVRTLVVRVVAEITPAGDGVFDDELGGDEDEDDDDDDDDEDDEDDEEDFGVGGEADVWIGLTPWGAGWGGSTEELEPEQFDGNDWSVDDEVTEEEVGVGFGLDPEQLLDEQSQQQQQQQQQTEDPEEREEGEEEEEDISHEEYVARMRARFQEYARSISPEPRTVFFTDEFLVPEDALLDCRPDMVAQRDLECAMKLLFGGGMMRMLGRADLAGGEDRLHFAGMKALRDVHVVMELKVVSSAYGEGEFFPKFFQLLYRQFLVSHAIH